MELALALQLLPAFRTASELRRNCDFMPEKLDCLVDECSGWGNINKVELA